MTERATIQEQAQIGVELVPGTAEAATRKLLALKLSPKVEMTKEPFTGSGFKYPTAQKSLREWGSAPFDGVPAFNEMPYIFSSLLGVATSITDLGSGAHEWVWDVSSTDEAVTQTYTLETGQAIEAARQASLFFTSLKMGFPVSGSYKVSGSTMSQALDTNGVTLTAAGVAEDEPVLIQGGTVCIYLDDAHGNLGDTKLLRAFNLDVDFPTRKKEIWTIDCEQASFASLVDIAGGEPMISLTVAADGGTDLLATARANNTKFMRVHSAGPVIGGGLTHELEMDFAAKVDALDALGDVDGVYSQPYKLRSFHDPAWGKSHQVRVVTDLAAL